jgi:hypothetical protein
MPWLRWLVASFSLRRPGSVHVGFVVDRVALGQFFLRVLQFSHQYHFTMALHVHTSPGGWIGLFVATVQRHLTPLTYYHHQNMSCISPWGVIFNVIHGILWPRQVPTNFVVSPFQCVSYPLIKLPATIHLCSCRWGEMMSLNCSHQKGLLFIPQMIYDMESHGGKILTGKTNNLKKSMSQCHFDHHKPYIDWHMPPWWDTGD